MGMVCSMYETSSAPIITIGKSEGKGPLARPRHRWEGTKQDVNSSDPI
jgi:hypothetical protein